MFPRGKQALMLMRCDSFTPLCFWIPVLTTPKQRQAELSHEGMGSCWGLSPHSPTNANWEGAGQAELGTAMECSAGYGQGFKSCCSPLATIKPNTKVKLWEADRGDKGRTNTIAACEAGNLGSSLHPVPGSPTVPPVSFLNLSHVFSTIDCRPLCLLMWYILVIPCSLSWAEPEFPWHRGYPHGILHPGLSSQEDFASILVRTPDTTPYLIHYPSTAWAESSKDYS